MAEGRAVAPAYVPVTVEEQLAVAVQEGYHVGWTVTATGALMLVGTGSTVHRGAVALWPLVMGK